MNNRDTIATASIVIYSFLKLIVLKQPKLINQFKQSKQQKQKSNSNSNSNSKYTSVEGRVD